MAQGLGLHREESGISRKGISSMADMNVFYWAKAQKRVTNKSLREQFDITETEADEIYEELKAAGIIMAGGYVQEVPE